ncbi:MAG: type IX secretion system membrane protein PorP/SprF [Bacteroides sp.]|nr:type IX secretion system membrane protein PorP/SprF [Bacteroides sp.]MCD8080165.1 type IX secretion system membrane protein PorP/SprF [Bacteroides sp.]
MRKLTLILGLLLATVAAHAQFEQNKWFVNPSLTGLNFSYSKAAKSNFGIQAQGGAFIIDNAALLLTLGADWSSPVDIYTVGVGGRYYFDQNGIFLGTGFKFNRYKYSSLSNINNFAWNLEAGYAFFLSRTVTVEPSVYYDLSFKDSDLSQFGFKIGFGFYF